MNKIILVFILGIIAYGASPAIGARGNGKGNNQNNNQRNGHSNIFNKDVQLPTDVPNALKPVIGKCEATFTGWEISAINSIPVVFINAIPNAIPNETNTTLGFLASNTKINKKDPNAIPSVNSLANDLKIGDKIKIDFVYVDEIRQIVDISLVSKINTETPMSFTLTGINSARMNSIERTKVKAIKNKMNCSFYVPSVPGTKDKTFINDPEMTKKLDQFSSGDEINIDYSTSNYMFIIKDVSPTIIKDHGKVVDFGEKNIINNKLGIQNLITCSYITVSGSKGEKCIFVHPSNNINGLPVPNPGLEQEIKNAKKNQEVEYKYYQQSNMCWLMELSLK